MKVEEVTLDVQYELGHSYSEAWRSSNLYCPACGDQTVWHDAGAGDYYEGPRHICTSCSSAFSLPRLETADGSNWQDKQRLMAITEQH